MQARTREAVQNKQPHKHQRGQQVHPVGRLPHPRVVDLEEPEAGQQNTRDKQHDDSSVERQPRPHCVAVVAPPGAAHVQGTKQQRGHQQQQPQAEMREEHQQVKIVLVVPGAELAGHIDDDQIQGIDCQQPEQRQHKGQQTPQTRADDRGHTCLRAVFGDRSGCHGFLVFFPVNLCPDNSNADNSAGGILSADFLMSRN